MKSYHRYVTLLATASLLLGGSAYAQSSSGAGAGSSGAGSTGSGSTGSGAGTSQSGSTSTSRTTGSNSGSGMRSSDGTTSQGSSAGSTFGSTAGQAGAGSMSRISKDRVENRLTASDLIGAAVYDAAGERIGDIADIDLQGAVPGSLMMSYNQSQSNRSGSGSYATGSAGTGRTSGVAGSPTTGTGGMGSATTGAGSTGSGVGSSATTGSSTGSSTATAGRTTPSSSAADALRDSSRAALSSLDSASGAKIFLSVGGLWGIGDDLVSVPMSMLSYNTSDERFQLSASKAEVVALTEEPDRDAGYAATGTGIGSATGMNQTAAGKQAFGDDASRVQAALRSDPDISNFAHGVTVTSDGDTLELRGSVETNDQKRKIVEAAREATSLKVDDDGLTVRQ